MEKRLKYLKTFEELSDNDYRNDDPISKLKMMELIYNTIIDSEQDQISHYKMEDNILDMETSEISFKYEGVPFKLTIEREDKVSEMAVGGGVSFGGAPCSPNAPTLPRKSTVKKIKKLGKKSGEHKSTKSAGGKNAITGNISSYK